jgi:hypothetical protein
VIFGVLLLITNVYFPLLPGDDLLYQLSFPADGIIGDHKISSLADYISSIVNHYSNYNPRVLPHAILQAVLLLPEWFFNVLNTVFFFFLAYIILDFSNLHKKNERLFLYFILLLFIWIFHFAIGRAYLWTSGAVNYTWFLIPQLLFLKAIYRTEFTKNDLSWKGIFLAFLCATSNENVVFVLFIICLIYSLRMLLVNRICHYKLWACTLILLLGGMLMLFSPSLQERLINEGFTYSTVGQRLLSYVTRLCYYILLSIPLLFFLLYGKFQYDPKRNVLLLVGLMSHLIMIVVPHYFPRSAVFPFTVFLIYMLGSVDFDFRKRKFFSMLLVVLALLCFMTRISFVKEVGRRTNNNYQTILQSKSSQDTAYVSKVCYNNKSGSLFCDDFSDHPDLIGNEIAESYFNINKIVIDPEYSIGQRREKYISKQKDKSGYRRMSFGKHIIYLKKDRLGMEIISQFSDETDIADDNIVILRGSRAGFNLHLFYEKLPLNYRIFFLDYLEHHAGFLDNHSGQEYYNYMFNSEDYSYIILSLYSLNDRRIVGEPIRVDLGDL